MMHINISHSRRRRRRAVTMVESTIILAICVLLLLGMLELSLALVRHTAMCEAARRVARAAIVHGAMASPSQGCWGPEPLSTTAADSHPAAVAAREALMTLNPAEVLIAIEWPDADNQPDSRVRVAVHCTHQPIVPIPAWYSQLDLRGVSTMRIAH